MNTAIQILGVAMMCGVWFYAGILFEKAQQAKRDFKQAEMECERVKAEFWRAADRVEAEINRRRGSNEQ